MAWSNPELIELAAEFVPGADEVWRLQNGEDFECELFRRFSEQGHYRAHDSTRQGVYLVTPNGRLLGSANTRDPRRLAALLQDGLAAWTELEPEQRSLPAAERERLVALWRWNDEYPADGLVLEIITRDLPRDEVADERKGRWTDRAWNRDYAWFRADEARAWVPAKPRVGIPHPIPIALIERLVCFHLVDSVRGQTNPYEPDDLTRAELTATVTAVDDAELRLELRGGSRAAVDEGPWPRSFEAEWQGTATWDSLAERFTAFELVAVGTRTGATRFNERGSDPGPAPIGVVLRLAAADAPRVAPTWIYRYGWSPLRRAADGSRR